MMSIKDVAVLIVSDRILQSKKSDNFSKFLLEELNALKYNVGKVSIVLEELGAIANELVSLISSYSVIIAIGESCSQIYQALSALLSEDMQQNEDLVKILLQMKEPINSDVCTPARAKILCNKGSYPVVHFQRIFILNQNYWKESFTEILKSHLETYKQERVFRKTIQIVKNGNANASLSHIQQLSSNGVKLNFSNNHNLFTIEISSEELSHIVDMQKKIEAKFSGFKINYVSKLEELEEKIYRSNEKHIIYSIQIIEKCLLEYGPENIFLCFNGGKDCTVLLHLALVVLKAKFPHYTNTIFCMYVQSKSPFPEQDEFINECQYYYNLKVMTVRSEIKEALAQILSQYPHYRACLMGTRNTDPYSKDLNAFQMTDPNWPQIMRVSPLLQWHYNDIWDYLLFYKVPYCKLYDLGFTSLGNTENTIQNPSLIYHNQSDKKSYLPAWKLLKADEERNGRKSS